MKKGLMQLIKRKVILKRFSLMNFRKNQREGNWNRAKIKFCHANFITIAECQHSRKFKKN